MLLLILINNISHSQNSTPNADTTNGDDSGSVRLYSLVNSTNSAPVATAQTVTATEQTAKTITLAGTDADGDTLSYIVSSLPSNGTLTDNGTAITSDDLPKTTTSTDLVYTSTSDSATSDSFTFKVNDGCR